LNAKFNRLSWCCSIWWWRLYLYIELNRHANIICNHFRFRRFQFYFWKNCIWLTWWCMCCSWRLYLYIKLNSHANIILNHFRTFQFHFGCSWRLYLYIYILYIYIYWCTLAWCCSYLDTITILELHHHKDRFKFRHHYNSRVTPSEIWTWTYNSKHISLCKFINSNGAELETDVQTIYAFTISCQPNDRDEVLIINYFLSNSWALITKQWYRWIVNFSFCL